MKSEIALKITEALEKAYPNNISKGKMPDFEVDYADEKFGDFSTNAAMKIGKIVGERPIEIAKKIIEIIGESEIIEKASVANPGFINFKIALPFWQKIISEVVVAGDKYGQSDLGKDLKVNIEFISANPTGPLTIGNSRGGIIGDVLSNVFKVQGWDVTREYYFNDAGGQIDVLGHSVLGDAQAEYKGEYIDKFHEKLDGGDAREIGKKAAQVLIEEIKKTTQKMGIKFDVWTAEGKDLRDKGKINEIIEWLKKNDLAYEKEGALWFKSTEFSDDKDRVLIRSNGEPTYFAVDCAYHKDKLVNRGFDKAIDVWGADHHGDLARLKGFVKALGYEEKFDILVHQFIRIIKDGQEVRMSKRAGNYILVDDLLNEVGKDVYRFFMLTYSPDSHLTFDLKLAKEQSQKNPVYYVQYAYARIHSILAKLKTQSSKRSAKGKTSTQNLKLLNHPAEIALIKQLSKLPEIIIEIIGDYQVQKLPFYAVNLADAFHRFYEECPVLQADGDLQSARLELIRATQIVLKNTLDLMGVSAPEKM